MNLNLSILRSNGSPVALLILSLTVLRAYGQEAQRPDITVADFEMESYGDWLISGTAFGTGPAKGTLPNQMAVEGFVGKGLVNSFTGGDESTGGLTSPEFRIERNYITYFIGGGMNHEKLSLQLIVDGHTVRQATGPNDRPGGSENLQQESWDVSEFLGKTGVLRIIDDAKGGWGHINVDQIVQSDTKPRGFSTNVVRQFVASSRYLHLPIKNGAPKHVVTLMVDGKVAVRNDIELADGEPDWWAPMDVSAWKGRALTLHVDKLRDDSTALSSIEQSDTLKDSKDLYHESLRGQFHFSPRRGWNNDPNGLVFFNNEYHLFFQHNPYGWGWGNMHWGHAVSKDLIHWQELRDELLPDEMGPMFSGSAVVDWKNTSGLGTNEHPPLILVYTAAGNPTVQGIAYSTDGRNFTKYRNNPVLAEVTGGNRDPKVMWHAPTNQWVMVLYVELEGAHTIHFFTSPNLREWTYASKTEGFFECPDFFQLPINGDAADKKWVLLGASSEYMLGSFDGKSFTPETPKLPGHRGRGFYAAQSFSDIPEKDGRRIFIGWFQTETRGMPFNQSMSVPLELGLKKTAAGPRMTFQPVAELTSLRDKSHRLNVGTLKAGKPIPLEGIQSETLEIQAEFEPSETGEITFLVRGASIVYDSTKQELVVNGHRAAAPMLHGKQRLHILVDRIGLEVFASDGLCYLPMPFIADETDLGVSVACTDADVPFSSLNVYELASAWKPRTDTSSQ